SATIDIDLPARPSSEPSILAHRAAAPRIEIEDRHVRISARDLSSNAWIEPTVRLPRGSVLDAPPQWQQRSLRTQTLAPFWLGAAGLVLAAGIILLFAIHQSYDAPLRDGTVGTPVAAAPDALAPAVAGTLTTNGRARL